MKQRVLPPVESNARRRPIAHFVFEQSPSSVLPEESQRALAVLRALDVDDNVEGVRALLTWAGSEVREVNNRVVITPSECGAVARALRRSGYPLNDDGLVRFKRERGYSRVVRIGPEVAAAFGRFAVGRDARLQVSPSEWRRLRVEGRRALRLLAYISRDPELFMRVQQALGAACSTATEARVLAVGALTANRLLAWAKGLGITLDNHGLRRLELAVSQQRQGPGPRRLENLALPLAHWIVGNEEPRHDYARLCLRDDPSLVVNRRTQTMLGQATRNLAGAGRCQVIRGSYCDNDVRGAHPHKGGGVVDLAAEDMSPDEAERTVAALRHVGFAAWYRPRRLAAHIHAVAIGDRELCPAAEWQVRSYFLGRDGRTHSRPDVHRDLPVSPPAWAMKYGVRYL